MIDVYTINKKYGDPVQKRKALKFTDKTVTFENGSRENLSNDYREHFDTLEKAVEFFEQFKNRRRSKLESELKELDERGDKFFDFVWKEKESAK